VARTARRRSGRAAPDAPGRMTAAAARPTGDGTPDRAVPPQEDAELTRLRAAAGRFAAGLLALGEEQVRHHDGQTGVTAVVTGRGRLVSIRLAAKAKNRLGRDAMDEAALGDAIIATIAAARRKAAGKERALLAAAGDLAVPDLTGAPFSAELGARIRALRGHRGGAGAAGAGDPHPAAATPPGSAGPAATAEPTAAAGPGGAAGPAGMAESAGAAQPAAPARPGVPAGSGTSAGHPVAGSQSGPAEPTELTELTPATTSFTATGSAAVLAGLTPASRFVASTGSVPAGAFGRGGGRAVAPSPAPAAPSRPAVRRPVPSGLIAELESALGGLRGAEFSARAVRGIEAAVGPAGDLRTVRIAADPRRDLDNVTLGERIVAAVHAAESAAQAARTAAIGRIVGRPGAAPPDWEARLRDLAAGHRATAKPAPGRA
jgi:DNA-binding protein YbaB